MNAGLFFRKQKSSVSREGRSLKAEIDRVMLAIESAQSRFNTEADPILIDCSIYELNAALLRYQFLIRRYKRLEKLAETAPRGERFRLRRRIESASLISWPG